jgi:hypothetical protein
MSPSAANQRRTNGCFHPHNLPAQIISCQMGPAGRLRWIVERTFGWLIKSRRLVRDYEVRLDHSESMIRICMIRLMVKRLAAR